MSDWRDGFLFVGNQLSLDFVNTRPVTAEGPIELLPDPASLARWLKASGILEDPVSRQLENAWQQESPAAMRHLIGFREALRAAVLAVEAGRVPGFLEELNRLLAAHPSIDSVVRSGDRLERRKVYEIRTPSDALAPILDATADLLTSTDWSKIRQCSTCVLHFLDTSKRGVRRWCSMQMCGNRSKVAAYYQRHHDPPNANPTA